MANEIAILYLKIADAFRQKKPFVSYRKPNTTEVSLLIQKDANTYVLNDFSESGFVFAPFDSDKKSIFFPLQKSSYETFLYQKNETVEKPILQENTTNQKETHIALVKKGIDFIKNKNTPKIVLSRKETIELANFNVIKTFKNLLQHYKTAFTYIWYHPNVGLWLGATPETLLKTINNVFKTIALAGTQVYKNTLDVLWEEKEKQEQQFVTDYIVSQLNQLDIPCKVSLPFTIKASNIVHLCTDITGRLKTLNALQSVVKALHPTPAVCGLPKEKAKNFILKNEGYDREFYTGFFGELNFTTDQRQSKNNKRNIENHAYNFLKKQSHLFVNLRCMQVHKNSISLYIGGGITKDSNAEKEYLETVAKAAVMKKVISLS